MMMMTPVPSHSHTHLHPHFTSFGCIHAQPFPTQTKTLYRLILPFYGIISRSVRQWRKRQQNNELTRVSRSIEPVRSQYNTPRARYLSICVQRECWSWVTSVLFFSLSSISAEEWRSYKLNPAPSQTNIPYPPYMFIVFFLSSSFDSISCQEKGAEES